MSDERIEVQRTIEAEPAAIFAVVRDPQGHVAIDATGMLQDADGEPVRAAGDTFVVHMDREALNDFPLGKYDVTVQITDYEKDALIAWTIEGQISRRSGTCTATVSNPTRRTPTARSSPRSTTGARSTSTGATQASSRWSPSWPCAALSESSTAPYAGATPAADRQLQVDEMHASTYG